MMKIYQYIDARETDMKGFITLYFVSLEISIFLAFFSHFWFALLVALFSHILERFRLPKRKSNI